MANPVIFHVDVNSAFLSWEAWERKAAAPTPRTCGRSPPRWAGTGSSAMASFLPNPLRQGLSHPNRRTHRKGPGKMSDPYHCPAEFPAYVKHSRELISLLESYAPSVEQYSIDEAFCDMTGTRTLYGDPVAFAHRLKDEIRDTLGFTVNIGVSTTVCWPRWHRTSRSPIGCTRCFRKRSEKRCGRCPWRSCSLWANPPAESCGKWELPPSDSWHRRIRRS